MLKYHPLIYAFTLFFLTVNLSPANAENVESASVETPSGASVLVQASICEKVEMLDPVNQGAAFSVKRDRVFCLTTFNPVSQKSYVYHTWFQRNKLVKIKRLPLYPPRWTNFSSIQLRQADKGPWCVEINDREGHLLKILRFSVTE